MNVIFLDRVFLTEFLGFRTHVVATTVCTTVNVHTLGCCTHIFLRTARSLRTSHTSHACHIHAWLKGAKKVLCTEVVDLHLAFSVSCLTHLWCLPTTTLSFDFPVHTVHLRKSSEKFGYLAKSAFNTEREEKKSVEKRDVEKRREREKSGERDRDEKRQRQR